MKKESLKQMTENIWIVTDNVDLVYSSLDEEETGKGYYLQKYPGGLTSGLYATDAEAIQAHKNNTAVYS